MDVFSELGPLFQASKFLGLVPIEVAGDPGKRRVAVSRQYQLFGAGVVCFILALKAYNVLWFKESKATAVVTISVVLTKNNFDVALTLLALVLHNVNASRVLHFTEELDALDGKIRETLGVHSINFKSGQRFVFCQVAILLAFVVAGGLAICYMFLFLKDGEVLYPKIGYWLLYFSSLLINLMFAANFLSYVFLLRQRFAALKRKMEELVVAAESEEAAGATVEPKFGSRLPSNNGVDQTIVDIRKAHFKLGDLAGDINDIYSPLMLLFFASAFAGITILLNNCFEDMRRIFHGEASPETPLFIGFCLYLVASLMLGISVIAGVCTSACHEANRLALPLHGLLATSNDSRARTQAEKFSLQLLHRKLRFTAFGFFPIDATLVYAIVGGVTTYLVILIQFDLSLKPAPP